MAKSNITIQILDNNLVGDFMRLAVNPVGNIDKWIVTTFTAGIPANTSQCQVGGTIAQTITNLKTQIDNRFLPDVFYTTTVTASDTLNIEIEDDYLRMRVDFEDLGSKAIFTVDSPANIKYTLDYLDVVNIKHEFNLSDENWYDAPIQIQGSVVMDYGQVDEILEAYRGQGLRVSLDANENLTFEDLFTEQERVFYVEYKRDSVILFKGWLNPEGFYEDVVNDKWQVSFDCIDGLGYLSDLAFVNSNGTNITGIKTQLEILSLALQRTGIQSDINIGIDIFYTGLSDTLSVLANVNANTRRYIKDDEGTDTVMNCEEVIRDVLEPYGAVLTSYNGQWVIYKPNQLYSDTEQTFFRYDYLGVALSPTTVDFEFGFTLGSQINSFYPHHCNENQQLTNKSSIGAYRINSKFGEIQKFTENPVFESTDGDITGITDWTFISEPPINGLSRTSYSEQSDGSNEVRFRSAGGGVDYTTRLFYNSDVFVISGSTFTLKSSYRGPASGFGDITVTMKCRVILSDKVYSDGTKTEYFYDPTDQTWSLSDNLITFDEFTTASIIDRTTEIDIENLPINGYLYVVWSFPKYSSTSVAIMRMYYCAIEAKDLGYSGEIFTFQREDNPSARVFPKKEIFTSDEPTNAYLGTLYKADGVTPTETWFRKGVTETETIIEIMGAETMRMNQNTMRIFSGDVYGYFNYLSVMELDGRVGKFGVTKYSYDTVNNITSAEFKQMFADELTDLNIEVTKDYGTVVEPTIRG